MSELYKIEKNIPISGTLGNKYKAWADTAERMEVGDSFFIPIADVVMRHQIQSNILGSFRKGRCRGKFATRKVEGGLRVWRVE